MKELILVRTVLVVHHKPLVRQSQFGGTLFGFQCLFFVYYLVYGLWLWAIMLFLR